MNQFGQSNTDDLQKAIDEITGNSGNAASSGADIAAELEAQIKNQMGVPPVPPMPVTPIISNSATGSPVVAPAANGEADTQNEQPGDSNVAAPVATPVVTGEVEEVAPATPVAVNAAEEPVPVAVNDVNVGGAEELGKVKEMALKELIPLMDKIELSAKQKFDVYTDVIELSKDKSIVEKAFVAARAIDDDKVKAESLLKLVQLIDTL